MNPKFHYPKTNKILILACLLALSATSVQAVDVFWSLGTGSYNTPTAWTNNAGVVVFPGGTDNAIVNDGATVLINPGDPNWVVNDIRAGDNRGGAEPTASGSWIQDGPTVTLNGWFRLALGAGTTGSYNFKSGTMNDAGRLIVGEGGTATFWQTNTTANNTVNVSGELWCGEGSTGNGTVNVGGNARMTVNNWFAIGRNGSTGVFNLSGNASVTKTGGGNITFAGLTGATANGTLNQTGGTVTNETSETWLSEDGVGVWNMSAGSATLALLQFGRNGGANGTFNLNGGILSVNQITLGTGVGTLNFNGGTLMARAGNASFMSGASGVVQTNGAVIDSQGFDIVISSTISDDGGGGTLTKKGSGVLTLSGPNTYTGATIVAAGKLIADTAWSATGTVIVSNTAGFGVNVSALNAQHSPAIVTLAAGATTLNFDLGAFGNPTSAPLNVGTLNVNGTTTIDVADAKPLVGQFPLIKYGTKTGVGSIVLGTLPSGVVATLVNNTGNSSIDLNVTFVSAPRWDGQVNGTWDIGTTANWIELSTSLATTYGNGNPVLFNDSASGTTNITLGVTVSPGSVTVTNDTLTYTLTGSGSISGATGLTKQGINSLTIGTTNNYTGKTLISGGTLSISKLANGGSPSSIGSSPASAANLVFAGGTLSYTGPAVTTDRGYTLNAGNSTLDAQSDMIFNGALSATLNGNFAKSGNGTLYVKRTGANTLSAGGGGGAYNIVNGGVVMDGSGGAQVNTVNGEVWVGGTTNSTGGKLILTNTTLNVSSWLAIARGSGTGGYTSSVSVYNSKLGSGNFSMAFDNGIPFTLQTGVLTLNGTSTCTNTGDSNIGESNGGQAIINLNDSSVFFSNNRAQLGWHGGATGVLNVANSAKIVVNAWFSIGNEGGDGRILLKDNASLACTDLNLCDVNTGTADLLVKDNAVVNAGLIFVGKGPGSTGTFTMTNNATVTSGNFIIGASNPDQTPAGGPSTGTATLSGGTLSVPLVRGQPLNGSASTFNFDGGKLVARASAGRDFVFDLVAANVLAGGAVIQIDNSNIRNIPQDLLDGGGGGGLTKLGNGTLLLGGNNTYTGSTVASAGVLGGSGTIAGPVTIQSTATLSPGGGAGIATLTVNNNLTIAGNLLFAVNKTNTPATNDSVVVTGTLNKTGAGTLNVVNLGPTLNVGDSFTLFSKPLINGNALTVTGDSASWSNKLAIDGSIQVVAVVPTFTSGGAARLPDGNIALTANGAIGSTYKLWATTNLTLSPISSTWTLLSSGTVTTSPFTVNDLTATNYPRRFYIFSAP